MHVKHFEDLEIWKEARCLTKEIYRLTLGPKFSKDFSLRGQIGSAAVSVMSNIAEGFERAGNQEFSQFLTSRKVPAVKCDHNPMWQLIKDTFPQRNWKNY
jgi:hypothetical protein